ncbi:MAG: hypothetical protein NWE89_03055 [Candidatus Bathyarchaeota archaeon]|nr:hypothetical protein [Candidatus Bathyarchaeota archaeon]
MGVWNRADRLPKRYKPLIVFFLALAVRLTVWLYIPIDWNWDSYHHWQISYLSLKVGFSQWRLWDLNGCEYLWGVVPHLVQAAVLGVLDTSSILPMRVINLLLGSFNAVLVYLFASSFFSERTGFMSGLLYGFFPIASVFDVLAMQDTMALTFLLASLYLIRSHPFWSGLLLALAGQSRTELMAVGMMIILGYCLRERLYTESLPYILGWLIGTGVFAVHLFTQTGNPFYSLYWSLMNVFGGFDPVNEGRPFMALMVDWALWKLSVWPRKLTGLMILFSGLFTVLMIPIMAIRRWIRYQPQLYFLSVLTVLTPIFITYLGADTFNLLIMLRMVNPIAALGFPLFVHFLNVYASKHLGEPVSMWVQQILLTILVLSFLYFIPAYSEYQGYTSSSFISADLVESYYIDGTIVCDYPTMNYWLVSNEGINPKNLLGNHYSPHYYGKAEPMDYARWLHENNVTLWVYYNERSQSVWDVLDSSYPGLLVHLDEASYARIYSVNQTMLQSILGEGE